MKLTAADCCDAALIGTGQQDLGRLSAVPPAGGTCNPVSAIGSESARVVAAGTTIVPASTRP